MTEATPTGVPVIQQRNIVAYVLLTIVTCGLFGIYWFITLTDDANKISGHPEKMNGVVSLLLAIVTCGIWYLVWAYNLGKAIDEAKTNRGLPASGAGGIYLILTLVGCGFIAEIMAQSELNKLAA